MEQRVGRPADPKILLDILRTRAKPFGRGVEGAEHRLGTGCEHRVISRVHAFVALGFERARDDGIANSVFVGR